MHKLGNHQVEFSKFFDQKGREVIFTQVFSSDGKRLAKGRTICSSKDNFDKNIGRKKAMAAALTKSVISKKERKAIWEDYRTKMTTKPRW